MRITIRGNSAHFILAAGCGADVTVSSDTDELRHDGYDPDTGDRVYRFDGPDAKFIVLDHSKLMFTDVPFQPEPQPLQVMFGEPGPLEPGPFLDTVVRQLGYEARRRRPRKVAR